MKNTPIQTIKAITIDLDDTLWPIWPAIDRAEAHLHEWMKEKAPATAAATTVNTLRELRNQVEQQHPEWKHDLSAYRREAIRLALIQNGDDAALAEEGFHIFFQMRQQVDFFDDAIPALEYLSTHYPVVAVSNGNANLEQIGISQYFTASVSAQNFGIAKPDARIFHEAARLTGINDIQSQEILHIGDDYRLDIAGARNAGLQAAWLVRPDITDTSHTAIPCEMAPQYQVQNLLELCQALAG